MDTVYGRIHNDQDDIYSDRFWTETHGSTSTGQACRTKAHGALSPGLTIGNEVTGSTEAFLASICTWLLMGAVLYLPFV